MGDDKNTEELVDVSGGPDTVAPSITDALEDVDGGQGSTILRLDPDVEGFNDKLFEGVDGGDGAQTPVNPQITD